METNENVPGYNLEHRNVMKGFIIVTLWPYFMMENTNKIMMTMTKFDEQQIKKIKDNVKDMLVNQMWLNFSNM